MTSAPPRWSVALQTTPNAKFAVAGDAVVIPGYAGARSDHLFAFALADGDERWRVALDDFVLASALSGVELVGDPAGDAVYLAQDSMVACFDAATGAKRWAVQVPATPPFESFTFAHPPVVAGHQLLLLSRHSRVVSLDRRDGTLRFQTTDQDAALDLVICDDVAVTRSREAFEVRAHDLATGDAAWIYPLRRPFPRSSRLGTSIRL
ncbi:MAG TPA: PQQ-binding-like beta-propeller repeat protein, partial [Kofleriaceae bacterium]|nr:PQQ-binding-like beta-propeller repeat protein [Kofleriaceae bacterium]